MGEPTKKQFIQDMAEFTQDGIWREFCSFMKERGVSSKQTEIWIEEIENGKFE